MMEKVKTGEDVSTDTASSLPGLPGNGARVVKNILAGLVIRGGASAYKCFTAPQQLV